MEIGYGLAPAQQGQGYATEFVQALIEAAFVSPSVTRLIAHTEAANLASQRVLHKNGFVRHGFNEQGQWRWNRERDK